MPRVHNYGAMHVGEGHDVLLFPAAIRAATAPQVETIIEEGQSSCFFHPKLPATQVCDISGRLICDLCQTEWNGRIVSFEALQSAVSKDDAGAQANTRIRWDNIALGLAVLPLLLWFITIATAPVALFIAIWQGRKGPCSVVQRSGWRYLLAGVLALVQIGLWAFLFLFGFSV
jgi:hypothetical protein